MAFFEMIRDLEPVNNDVISFNIIKTLNESNTRPKIKDTYYTSSSYLMNMPDKTKRYEYSYSVFVPLDALLNRNIKSVYLLGGEYRRVSDSRNTGIFMGNGIWYVKRDGTLIDAKYTINKDIVSFNRGVAIWYEYTYVRNTSDGYCMIPYWNKKDSSHAWEYVLDFNSLISNIVDENGNNVDLRDIIGLQFRFDYIPVKKGSSSPTAPFLPTTRTDIDLIGATLNFSRSSAYAIWSSIQPTCVVYTAKGTYTSVPFNAVGNYDDYTFWF